RRETPQHSFVYASLTNFLVVNEHGSKASFPNPTAIVFKINANRSGTRRKSHGTCHLVAVQREPVVFICWMTVLYVESVAGNGATRSDQNPVGSFFWNIDKGRNCVRTIFDIRRGTLRDAISTWIVNKISSSRDQAWPVARIDAFTK